MRWYTRTCFLSVLCIVLSVNIFAQQSDSTQIDLVDLLVKKKKKKEIDEFRAKRKVHFSLLPAAVSIPGGGRAVITSINAAFYTGDPSNTNLSNVYLIPYTNFIDRYGLYIRPTVWTPKNRLNIIGDYRIAHFPQYSWGLGGDSPSWDESLIDSDYARLYQTLLIKLFHHWFTGLGYALDYRYNIEESDFEGEGHLSRYGETGSTSVSSGFTYNLVFDSRTNAINPLRGSYLLFTWRWNTESLGSTYTNHALIVDARKYFPLRSTKKHTLAMRGYYWSILKGETPYLDLPATTWFPGTGIPNRGFQTGRYRSNALLYGEAEQRYQLSHNGLVGFVTFLNVTSASEFETQNFQYWKVGAGAGLRLKFNKYSDTNVAIDLAFSPNYWGVWVNIGEMF